MKYINKFFSRFKEKWKFQISDGLLQKEQRNPLPKPRQKVQGKRTKRKKKMKNDNDEVY